MNTQIVDTNQCCCVESTLFDGVSDRPIFLSSSNLNAPIFGYSSIACMNVYKDQYCNCYSGSCWDSNYATTMVNNCRKTCVCSCCPTTTTTTVTSTTISTALQITTEGTGEETTTALTSLSTQTTSEIKGIFRVETSFLYVFYVK